MARTYSGVEVNRAKLAEVFGISVDTVSAWIKRGCPVLHRGRKGVEWKFNTADVHRWQIEELTGVEGGVDPERPPPNMAKESARRAQYEADLKELELRHKRGELIEMSVMLDVVRSEYATVRTRLGSLPGRLAVKVDPARAIELQPIIADEVDDVLKELSADDSLAERGDGEGEGADGAAPDPALDAETGAAPQPG